MHVALLDQESGNVLDTDTHYFSYESGDGTTQSGTGSYDTPTGSYEYDDININYPNVYYLYSSNSNGLSIDWTYQSQSNDMQSLSWAYKLNEDFLQHLDECDTGEWNRQCEWVDLVEWTEHRSGAFPACGVVGPRKWQCIGYRYSLL